MADVSDPGAAKGLGWNTSKVIREFSPLKKQQGTQKLKATRNLVPEFRLQAWATASSSL